MVHGEDRTELRCQHGEIEIREREESQGRTARTEERLLMAEIEPDFWML